VPQRFDLLALGDLVSGPAFGRCNLPYLGLAQPGWMRSLNDPGAISWVTSINPQQAARLWQCYASINSFFFLRVRPLAGLPAREEKVLIAIARSGNTARTSKSPPMA